MLAEMHKWDGSHVSFLSKTELTRAEQGKAKPWVGAAMGWSHAAPNQ
jgi:hypothetical protein